MVFMIIHNNRIEYDERAWKTEQVPIEMRKKNWDIFAQAPWKIICNNTQTHLKIYILQFVLSCQFSLPFFPVDRGYNVCFFCIKTVFFGERRMHTSCQMVKWFLARVRG